MARQVICILMGFLITASSTEVLFSRADFFFFALQFLLKELIEVSLILVYRFYLCLTANYNFFAAVQVLSELHLSIASLRVLLLASGLSSQGANKRFALRSTVVSLEIFK